MLMRSERQKLCRDHQGLRRQWADVYEGYGESESGLLPYYIGHRLAQIGDRMRQIEADLGEEVAANDKCLWCHRLPPVPLHQGYCSSQCRAQGDPNYRPARRKR